MKTTISNIRAGRYPTDVTESQKKMRTYFHGFWIPNMTFYGWKENGFDKSEEFIRLVKEAYKEIRDQSKTNKNRNTSGGTHANFATRGHIAKSQSSSSSVHPIKRSLKASPGYRATSIIPKKKFYKSSTFEQILISNHKKRKTPIDFHNDETIDIDDGIVIDNDDDDDDDNGNHGDNNDNDSGIINASGDSGSSSRCKHDQSKSNKGKKSKHVSSSSPMQTPYTQVYRPIREDPTEKYLHEHQSQLIDEFTDVSMEEKELMKLWNQHVYQYKKNVSKVVLNSSMSEILRDFVIQNIQMFQKVNYRHLLGLLLLQFYENHLIMKSTIVDVLKIVN